MRISFYCSERSIYGNIGNLLTYNQMIYYYDEPIDWRSLNKSTFIGKRINNDGINIFNIYDRIVNVHDKADVIFYDNNFPSAGKAALKIANPDVVPFVFNSIEELEDMLKDANYL